MNIEKQNYIKEKLFATDKKQIKFEDIIYELFQKQYGNTLTIKINNKINILKNEILKEMDFEQQDKFNEILNCYKRLTKANEKFVINFTLEFLKIVFDF